MKKKFVFIIIFLLMMMPFIPQVKAEEKATVCTYAIITLKTINPFAAKLVVYKYESGGTRIFVGGVLRNVQYSYEDGQGNGITDEGINKCYKYAFPKEKELIFSDYNNGEKSDLSYNLISSQKEVTIGGGESTINESDVQCDTITEYVWKGYYILIVAGVILTVVLGILDFINATASSDKDNLKKAYKKFFKRVIVLAVLLLLPYILEFIFKIIPPIQGVNPDNPLCR